MAPVAMHQPGGQPAASSAPAPAAETDGAHIAVIKSPMVGTYYSKPNPTSKDFVEVGSMVQNDTVVCIIEAMKVFNEIKAEKDGVIDAILVKDGQAVEFGQKLFALK
jgi:acetyl-CoA carboxylase biotin carboxyl carrier protein